MPNTNKPAETNAPKRATPALSLLVQPAEQRQRNVNAEQFFALADRWLKALQAFASDTGQRVTWEIVELKKSSAFVQVRPVEPQTRKPVPALVRKWDSGLREVERTGRPPRNFTANSLGALQEFVRSVPPDSAVTLGDGSKKKPLTITAKTQRRVEEAVAAVSATVPAEYSVRGKLRGRLAILNSWNPAERHFRLQIPLAPGKPVTCTYKDEHLVSELGSEFEGVVEVEGLLHYRREEVWPHRAEVDAIRVLSREKVASLKDLVGLLPLPEGQDSVSYIRSLRDAD
jgi:hypothetical protein